MTVFERLELIRAGYKRAEIDAMIKADEDAAKAPPKEEPKQEESKKPPEQPKEQQKEQEQPSEVDTLKSELAELRKQMQLQNIQKIGLDTPPQKPVEEVLAEAVFGNPEKKVKE